MSILTLGDSPVISAAITRPLRGSWTSDLEVDADAAPSGKLTLAGAGLSLVGTVVQSQSWNDRQRARVVAGAGGMRKVLAPAWYRGVTLRTIVKALLEAAGETLSSTSDSAVLSKTVPAWVRLRGTTAALLDQVLAVFASTSIWRHLADGTVWIGVPAWPTVTTTAVVQDNRGDEEIADLAGEDLALEAGVTVLGRKVGMVRHRVSVNGLRTEASWLRESDRGITAAITGIVERIVGPRLDMRAAYPSRVVTQHADGTLDVVPDSDRLPALTKVPIRYGVPGVTAKVRTGARVIVEFANGDPSSPYASVWESASLTELVLNGDVVKLAGGDRPIAREGDPVTIIVDKVTATAIVALAVPAAPPVPLSATGYILRGSQQVKSL